VVARVNGSDRTFNIEVTQKTTAFRATLDGPPSIVAVDPHLHVLKTINEEKPLPMWFEQARHGPTIAARHAALEALGKHDSPDTIALFAQIIRDEKARHTLRNTAVNALAGLGSTEAKDTLLKIVKDGVPEARVRSTLIEKLAKYEKDVVGDLLAEVAANDASYGTRVAAIEALASLKASDKADVIVQLVDFPSQHDQVRNAALRALASLDEPRGLELAIKYSAYGYVDRSRPTAVNVINRLAKHDRDAAVTHLIALLNDPESRTVSAAGSALAEIGDNRAAPAIRAMAESHRDPAMKRRAEGWLRRLQERNPETGSEQRPARRRAA
jgi:HEAT repeat protein